MINKMSEAIDIGLIQLVAIPLVVVSSFTGAAYLTFTTPFGADVYLLHWFGAAAAAVVVLTAIYLDDISRHALPLVLVGLLLYMYAFTGTTCLYGGQGPPDVGVDTGHEYGHEWDGAANEIRYGYHTGDGDYPCTLEPDRAIFHFSHILTSLGALWFANMRA